MGNTVRKFLDIWTNFWSYPVISSSAHLELEDTIGEVKTWGS